MAAFAAMAAGSASESRAQITQEVVVGLALPSEGPKVELAKRIREIVRAAIGSTVRLLELDDRCSAEGGAEAAAKLVAEKVALVIGHPCSNAAIAAAKIYAAANVVMLGVGARHPDLTAKRAGPTIFRTGGRDDREAADTVAIFSAGLVGKKVAIVEDRTAYARGLTEGVAAGFKAHGVTDIMVEPIVAGEREYDAVVARIKVADVKAVYFAGFPVEAEVIMASLDHAGVSTQFIGCGALAGLRHPSLVVMTPRRGLQDERISSAIRQAIRAVTTTESKAELLASMSTEFDAGGDDKVPSYDPVPAVSDRLSSMPKTQNGHP